MGKHSFKAVILDLDGVITKTAKVHAKAWKQMFDEYLEYRKKKGLDSFERFKIDEDYPKFIDGKPRYDGVQSFLESREIDLPRGNPKDEAGWDTVCALGNRKNDLFHDIVKRDGVEVYEDTIEKIHKWKVNGL
jgi:trehalose 6-phosphate phosphatase